MMPDFPVASVSCLRMNRAEILATPAGLVPLARPLMTGEVLDAAFRVFRGGLLRSLPYSGLAVLVLELPTLYATFFRSRLADVPGTCGAFSRSPCCSASLAGRDHAASAGDRARCAAAFPHGDRDRLQRWPAAAVATTAAFGFPLLVAAVATYIAPMYTTGRAAGAHRAVPLAVGIVCRHVAGLLVRWPRTDSPRSAGVCGSRADAPGAWSGALLATACIVAVFYVLAAILVGMLAPMLGRADLFLIATVSSMLWLVVGALGVPFVLAVLIVAYEDLKLRDVERRGVRS